MALWMISCGRGRRARASFRSSACCRIRYRAAAPDSCSFQKFVGFKPVAPLDPFTAAPLGSFDGRILPSQRSAKPVRHMYRYVVGAAFSKRPTPLLSAAGPEPAAAKEALQHASLTPDSKQCVKRAYFFVSRIAPWLARPRPRSLMQPPSTALSSMPLPSASPQKHIDSCHQVAIWQDHSSTWARWDQDLWVERVAHVRQEREGGELYRGERPTRNPAWNP